MSVPLNEARLMLEALERLFETGEEKAYAAEVREVLLGDDSGLNTFLTSGDFWGGMGSMIDCAFSKRTIHGRDIDRRNRREFMRLIIKLGNHQLATGISTANIQTAHTQLDDHFPKVAGLKSCLGPQAIHYRRGLKAVQKGVM